MPWFVQLPEVKALLVTFPLTLMPHFQINSFTAELTFRSG